MMMLEDDDYNDSIRNLIETQSVNAEYAVATTADNFSEMFASMDDAYMQARAADVNLTQYTLAIDRQNAKLEPFCDTHHEAILRLIKTAADNAHQHGAWICLSKIWLPASH